MKIESCRIDHIFTEIKKQLANQDKLAMKKFVIGKNAAFNVAIIYIDNILINKNLLDKAVLSPLTLYASQESLNDISDLENYICRKYIHVNNTYIETDIAKATSLISKGACILVIENCWNYIIINTYQERSNIAYNIANFKKILGTQNELIVRNFFIGPNHDIEASLMYINGLSDKNVIGRDILNPLMLQTSGENFDNINNFDDNICQKYISASNTYIETDINKAADNIKRGKTVLIIQNIWNFIVIDTSASVYRSVEEPVNDISLRGPREGFIENIETNISIMRRRIKDKNLCTEKFTLGRRSQTDLIIMYISDIVDDTLLQKLRDKINTIDADGISSNGILEQYIEEHPYSFFPQVNGSERPDVIEAAIMEGRIAFFLNNTSYVTTYPAVFIEFFQTIEDYYDRTIQAAITRILRVLAVIIVIFFPPIYITLIKFNAELIPNEFIKSLVQSRKGIALTPFMSLLTMELTIDLLREGGLRMPGKIGQTLSVVGGIIIGDAALSAKIVSSTTLVVAGLATVASFSISNYKMSNAIRFTAYITLIMSNWLGVLGIVISAFFILAYLCSLENFGVPYFSFHRSDLKDIFWRAPFKSMNQRPQAIPHKDPVRNGHFRGEKNE